MKKNLTLISLVLLALFVLCSCFIEIDPSEPEPKTEGFTFTSVFKGPVKDKDGKITSYQFMCYVNNNTGVAVENLELIIDWKDQLGELIFSDTVTIPRLEKGGKWPVGVIRDKAYEITMLKDSTASIRARKPSSDLSRYSTNVVVTGHIYHPQSGDPSYATGYARHYNSYEILDPIVYVVSESSGKIIEYGAVKYPNIFYPELSTLDFEVTLNPPAKDPKNSKTSYYIVGTRREI
jgi:hypothetical protein